MGGGGGGWTPPSSNPGPGFGGGVSKINGAGHTEVGQEQVGIPTAGAAALPLSQPAHPAGQRGGAQARVQGLGLAAGAGAVAEAGAGSGSGVGPSWHPSCLATGPSQDIAAQVMLAMQAGVLQSGRVHGCEGVGGGEAARQRGLKRAAEGSPPPVSPDGPGEGVGGSLIAPLQPMQEQQEGPAGAAAAVAVAVASWCPARTSASSGSSQVAAAAAGLGGCSALQLRGPITASTSALATTRALLPERACHSQDMEALLPTQQILAEQPDQRQMQQHVGPPPQQQQHVGPPPQQQQHVGPPPLQQQHVGPPPQLQQHVGPPSQQQQHVGPPPPQQQQHVGPPPPPPPPHVGPPPPQQQHVGQEGLGPMPSLAFLLKAAVGTVAGSAAATSIPAHDATSVPAHDATSVPAHDALMPPTHTQSRGLEAASRPHDGADPCYAPMQQQGSEPAHPCVAPAPASASSAHASQRSPPLVLASSAHASQRSPPLALASVSEPTPSIQLAQAFRSSPSQPEPSPSPDCTPFFTLAQASKYAQMPLPRHTDTATPTTTLAQASKYAHSPLPCHAPAPTQRTADLPPPPLQQEQEQQQQQQQQQGEEVMPSCLEAHGRQIPCSSSYAQAHLLPHTHTSTSPPGSQALMPIPLLGAQLGCDVHVHAYMPLSLPAPPSAAPPQPQLLPLLQPAGCDARPEVSGVGGGAEVRAGVGAALVASSVALPLITDFPAGTPDHTPAGTPDHTPATHTRTFNTAPTSAPAPAPAPDPLAPAPAPLASTPDPLIADTQPIGSAGVDGGLNLPSSSSSKVVEMLETLPLQEAGEEGMDVDVDMDVGHSHGYSVAERHLEDPAAATSTAAAASGDTLMLTDQEDDERRGDDDDDDEGRGAGEQGPRHNDGDGQAGLGVGLALQGQEAQEQPQLVFGLVQVHAGSFFHQPCGTFPGSPHQPLPTFEHSIPQPQPQPQPAVNEGLGQDLLAPASACVQQQKQQQQQASSWAGDPWGGGRLGGHGRGGEAWGGGGSGGSGREAWAGVVVGGSAGSGSSPPQLGQQQLGSGSSVEGGSSLDRGLPPLDLTLSLHSSEQDSQQEGPGLGESQEGQALGHGVSSSLPQAVEGGIQAGPKLGAPPPPPALPAEAGGVRRDVDTASLARHDMMHGPGVWQHPTHGPGVGQHPMHGLGVGQHPTHGPGVGQHPTHVEPQPGSGPEPVPWPGARSLCLATVASMRPGAIEEAHHQRMTPHAATPPPLLLSQPPQQLLPPPQSHPQLLAPPHAPHTRRISSHLGLRRQILAGPGRRVGAGLAPPALAVEQQQQKGGGHVEAEARMHTAISDHTSNHAIPVPAAGPAGMAALHLQPLSH